MQVKPELTRLVFEKSQLKEEVYRATRESFDIFRDITQKINTRFEEQKRSQQSNVRFEFADRGDFEFQISFGGDILLFMMHSNIFAFSRDHQVMKTPYIREDSTRSYCGVIHIYNFLADSFIYQRDNDLGYLIGRVFINRERHYFIEGKRELGMLYNNFNTSVIETGTVQSIIESAIEYTTNFDLLTPPYDEVKMVSVGEMRATMDKKSIVTGKRLGFRFQSDTD
ncbi:MAG: hypothetical protein AUK63_1479 [bacterium P3]|nr:MAG: hypothetical protein AUK63_1479 [bacterium P3]KWW40027.1 MAG: hypothetical protein F083_1749 [bacterium F083]